MAGAGNRERRRGPALSWPIVDADDSSRLPAIVGQLGLFISLPLQLLLLAMDGTKYGTSDMPRDSGMVSVSSLLDFNLISTSCTGLHARPHMPASFRRQDLTIQQILG